MATYPVLAPCTINGVEYTRGQTTAELDAKRAHWLAAQGFLRIDGVTPMKLFAPLPPVLRPVRPRRCCGG
jgi:hypothetical protein